MSGQVCLSCGKKIDETALAQMKLEALETLLKGGKPTPRCPHCGAEGVASFEVTFGKSRTAKWT
jgi:DNA-directed RNA polymerase subunit RPC12/RpoP